MISHQKLLLHELNQLRIGNEQLRTENKQLNDKMNKKEFETTNKQTDLYRSDINNNWSIWILLALVITGIAILIPLILMERDRIHQNEQSIQSHEQSIQSNKQSIQSNKQSIQSHVQSIQSHEQSIQSNKQSIQSTIQSILSHELSIQSLMSTAGYITEFIANRGKTLQGIEWTHGYREDETVYGPIFYLGQCKLRMHVVTRQDSWHPSTEYGAKYYVRRLKRDNDDVINSCTITYIHFYNVNLADNSKFNIKSVNEDKQLEVGDEYWINSAYTIFNKLDKLTTEEYSLSLHNMVEMVITTLLKLQRIAQLGPAPIGMVGVATKVAMLRFDSRNVVDLTEFILCQLWEQSLHIFDVFEGTLWTRTRHENCSEEIFEFWKKMN
ncbi:hypothetical protein LOD99_11252 [Oopsacas minuta]|uniref:Uncharacterized protein n=1 Tax=Oopsacas minuta TaxID=111878 RepID=A0AAV7K5W3_9METZ|nr:hypothetical protein LOD99_11252 [Oopsacas minuta]